LAFPKIVEHSKNYLVQIELFGEDIFDDPIELRYLTTSFGIIHSGGSDFINQKGRNIASAFAKQPSVTVNFRCYMTNPEFAVLMSNVILNQEQIFMTIGRLHTRYTSDVTIRESTAYISDITSNSKTIYEIIGYMKNAKISANAGEFVIVDITVNADDVKEIDPDNIPEFNHINPFNQ